jgi:tryptophan halogenase
MDTSNRKIVVVGGGSAGWLTALMVHRLVKNSTVTVIESDAIGILGAGEGTTPHFIRALDLLGIPLSRVIKEGGATVKGSIKFTNWNSPNDKTDFYHHGFRALNPNYSGDIEDTITRYSVTEMLNVYHNYNKGTHTDFTALYSEKNKVPFVPVMSGFDYQVSDPIFNYENFASYGIHFNAREMAALLRKIAEERGILRKEGKVGKINSNSDGSISGVELTHGETVDLDFVFDCTGFARLIIGKHFNAPWTSYTQLPAKRAMPFFIPYDETHEVPPYTECIAMKYGWMWRVPVEGRYGSGYVFDTDFIDDDQAKQEVEEYLGHEINPPTIFNFQAGSYDTPWVKNCIAIGLSSGFLEPLEGTNLWGSVYALEESLNDPHALMRYHDTTVDRFNFLMKKRNHEFADFIYFHYMGQRNDTVFWEQFKDISKAPDQVQEVLEYWKHNIPRYNDFYEQPFMYQSWIQCARGQGLLNEKLIRETLELNGQVWDYQGQFTFHKSRQLESLDKLVHHNDFLKTMREM